MVSSTLPPSDPSIPLQIITDFYYDLTDLYTSSPNVSTFFSRAFHTLTPQLLADPLLTNLAIVTGFIVGCYILAFPTRNVSHVDRSWSIVPVIYALVFARSEWIALFKAVVSAASGGGVDLNEVELDFRLLAVSGLIFIWGSRLSYNFARKGGYSLYEEDYRWAYLRKSVYLRNPIAWELFHIFFINIYQHLLLFLITTPAYIAYLARGQEPWNIFDTLASLLVCLFLYTETTADQQQWDFHAKKHAYRKHLEEQQTTSGNGNNAKKLALSRDDEVDCRNGFLTQGLFRFSRHPNFVSEISIWWSIYIFSLGASIDTVPDVGVWSWLVNWTLVGAVLLNLLFLGSTPFTEWISLQKYPKYRLYQKTTSRLFPWFPGPQMADVESKEK
ncbi:hypothetical protein HK102_006683 [Quaeritorhiza haematococci]|nr:hypothetical protein HK102_006683 [Quaeritorhiza haematococci]